MFGALVSLPSSSILVPHTRLWGTAHAGPPSQCPKIKAVDSRCVGVNHMPLRRATFIVPHPELRDPNLEG